MNAFETTTKNKPALIGLGLMLIPLFFWVAALLDIFFGMTLFSDVFGRFDQASSLFTIALIFVLPMIALLINLAHIFNFNIKKEGQEITGTLRLRLATVNMGIIMMAAFHLGIVALYAFVENFAVVPTHF